MNSVLRSKPVFQLRALTEDGVLTALDNCDPDNPVAVEVTRLVSVYADTFQHRPYAIRNFKPQWPIEKVALRLAALYF